MDPHTDLIAALSAVPAANTSLDTLRGADRTIEDLPHRLVDAIAQGRLTLEEGLDGASDAPISFGMLAVLKWLATLGPERLDRVPASFFVARLASPDKKLRLAAARALAQFPGPALQWLEAHGDDEAVETGEVAAGLVGLLFRNGQTTPEDALRLVPMLERLSARLRGHAAHQSGVAAAHL